MELDDQLMVLESGDVFKQRASSAGRLEDVLEDQVTLVAEYMEVLGKAKFEADEAHNLYKAQLFSTMNDIRSDPGSYGLNTVKAPTEGSVESTARTEASVIKSRDMKAKAEATFEIAQGRREVLRNRRAMIENKIMAMNMGFFGEPRTDRTQPAAGMVRAQRVNQAADDKMRANLNPQQPLQEEAQ